MRNSGVTFYQRASLSPGRRHFENNEELLDRVRYELNAGLAAPVDKCLQYFLSCTWSCTKRNKYNYHYACSAKFIHSLFNFVDKCMRSTMNRTMGNAGAPNRQNHGAPEKIPWV